MTKRVRVYEHEGFAVEYEPLRCIHAEECVRGLPRVFAPGRRPWIDPSQAAPPDLAATITRCPTGALHYRPTAEVPAETPDPAASVEAVADGPLYVRGDIRLVRPDGEPVREERVALCRCGASQNKPYCDNSHIEAGFTDPGVLGEDWLEQADGPLAPGVEITPTTDGPFHLTGAIEVRGTDGQTANGADGWFCRCGSSQNKPFCDGSHRRIGFTTR